MHVASWPRWILLAAFVWMASACGDSAEEATTGPTVSSSVELPSPTAAEASTTTTATITTEVGHSYVYAGDFPEVLGGPLDAAGSGCAPGSGPLPDGIWFGFPNSWTTSSIDFDLACFYVGQAAVTEAANRGEESPPPNDYIITNDNLSLRAVPVAEGAIGYRIVAGSTRDGTEMEPVPFSDLMTDPGFFQNCPTTPSSVGDRCLMWLYVNDREVTEIVSQYVP